MPFSASSPKLQSFFILRVNKCKYGITEFVPFFLDDALEKGLPAYQALSPVSRQKQERRFTTQIRKVITNCIFKFMLTYMAHDACIYVRACSTEVR